MTSRYTRSKAHRPSTPALEESDVEPDDVAPVAATHSVSETTASIVYIRYDTIGYFNLRSKADTSQLNLPHGNNK